MIVSNFKGEKMSDQAEKIQYKTQGTCCRLIEVTIKDGKITDAEFFGGCNGNLKGIKSLIKGMTADDIIEKLHGISCGDKNTSCPDQLAECLISYKKSKNI